MTNRRRTLVLFLLILTGAVDIAAQTAREELSRFVEQLQKSPTDNALREKIIKLGAEMKPTPAIPEEAERRMARGFAAFKAAKSTAEYQDAIKEFEAAVAAGPWYSDAYFNLGVAQDKAEKYADALQSLKWALMASPDDKEIKALFYEVEFRNEKYNSPEARAAREKAATDSPEARTAKEKENAKKELMEFLRSLDGAVFAEPWESRDGGFRTRAKVKIQGEQLALGYDLLNANGRHVFGPETALGEQFSTLSQVVRLESLDISLGKTRCPLISADRDLRLSIDKTGRSMTLTGCEVTVLVRQ